MYPKISKKLAPLMKLKKLAILEKLLSLIFKLLIFSNVVRRIKPWLYTTTYAFKWFYSPTQFGKTGKVGQLHLHNFRMYQSCDTKIHIFYVKLQCVALAQ